MNFKTFFVENLKRSPFSYQLVDKIVLLRKEGKTLPEISAVTGYSVPGLFHLLSKYAPELKGIVPRGRKKISQEVLNKIISQRKKKKPFDQIGRKVGYSRTGVAKAIQKYAPEMSGRL